MTRPIGRAWVPIVDLIIQFEPKRVMCEVRSPAAGWPPELCAAGNSQREASGTGALLIGWRKVVRCRRFQLPAWAHERGYRSCWWSCWLSRD